MTILVGSPPVEFTVHDKVLKTENGSKFFQVAFDNGFKETHTGVLKLPEDDPEAFELLLHWSYGKAVGGFNCENLLGDDIGASTLLKSFVLASKYMLTSLHDAVITCMWKRVSSPSSNWLKANLTRDALQYYAANTMEHCKMDRLLVDWIVGDTVGSGELPISDHFYMYDRVPERLVRAVFTTLSLHVQKWSIGDRSIGEKESYLSSANDSEAVSESSRNYESQEDIAWRVVSVASPRMRGRVSRGPHGYRGC